jgi:hypothetical protein
MDDHLRLKVVDQVYFSTTQWVFLTEEKRVTMLGSSYAEVHMIGEYPESNWCIVSDWYNRELSVRNRTTLEKVYTLPLDKFLISGITSFQDKNKNWHIWIIPVVTVEKFTSNVFWISLKPNRMTIQNLDYHDPILVSDHGIDSEGNLFMIEEKTIDTEWSDLEQRWTIKKDSTIKNETNIIKVNPWSKKVQKLPIEWEMDKKNKENTVLLINPSIELDTDGILVRNFSNPYYKVSRMESNSGVDGVYTYYENSIVVKTKDKTFNAIDPVTMLPLKTGIPTSDIRKGIGWKEYTGSGIQNHLFISYRSFEPTT